MNILESLTPKQLPLRLHQPLAVVIHATGQTDLDKILGWYHRDEKDATQPHYFIETIGTVRRIVADERIAYHAGMKPGEIRLYRLGYECWSCWKWNDGNPIHIGHEFPGYVEWRDTWRPHGVQSPLDLVTRAAPNGLSIGIELQSPLEPTRDIFTDAQYASLAELLTELAFRHRIPLDRFHVLGHYDVSPLRRCNAQGSWDPGHRFAWLRLWDLLRKGGVT